MPAIVVVGAQWGDEGKGKATDILGGRVDYVVKPNGGNNAGHTVVVGGEKYELKLLPAGILSPTATPVIGNGVVVNLEALFEEIDALESRGVGHLAAADLGERPPHGSVPPGARQGDRALPRQAPHRHHGPRHRPGLRRQDQPRRHPRAGPLRREHPAPEGRRVAAAEEPNCSSRSTTVAPVSVEEIVEYFEPFIERLRPYVAETELMLNEALDRGEVVVMEGGQATMLDVDHGTYPFVTSSNPTAGGSCVGTGIGPTRINRVVGIVKAYTTRVGAGPFPTELFDEMGEYLQKAGGEFGVNTGRPRRCGWYDAVIARYAARTNGFTDYVLTKLDVLTGIDRIPVCVGYEVDGQRHDEMPVSADRLPPRQADPGVLPTVGARTSRRRAPSTTCRERAEVRARPRGALGLPDVGHRCRPRPRTVDRAPRPRWTGQALGSFRIESMPKGGTESDVGSALRCLTARVGTPVIALRQLVSFSQDSLRTEVVQE